MDDKLNIPQIKPEEENIESPRVDKEIESKSEDKPDFVVNGPEEDVKEAGLDEEVKPDFLKVNSEEESVLIPKEEIEAKKDEIDISPKTNNEENLKENKVNPNTKKIVIGVGVALLVFLLAVIMPGFFVYQKGVNLVDQSKALMEVAKSQNIPGIKGEIGKTKTSLTEFRNTYRIFSWTKIIPFFGSYVSDVDRGTKAYGYALEAGEITLNTIEPFADVLGISDAAGEGDGIKTTQERIDFIAQAIPTILPKLDEILAKADLAKTEIDKINPNRYPVEMGGRKIREPMKNAIELFDSAVTYVKDSKPILEQTPYLLGLDSPRTYMVLFQNDKELRPTGGFLTAYAIMKVDKARFEPVTSNDIYNLDSLYKPRIPAPDPIVNLIKGPYILSKNIRLRDMNFDPDFEVSMKTFVEELSRVGIKNIDGIIAVDTQMLVNLLDVIGPIGVSGFGNFSTAIEPKCNCPQVIYELESFADVEGPIVWDPNTGEIVYRPPNSDNRKKIIGPLMNSILANAMGQPKEKLPLLMEAGFKSLLEKHVLLYVLDEEAQNAVKAFNIGGTIKEYSGDYLHINDANLGGRKSNLYITQEVEQNIEVTKEGKVTKTVTITMKNPEKYDGWLNSVYPAWLRVYVPKGSKLIAQEGFKSKVDPYEELGKTVFAGGYELRPEGVQKMTLKYELPMMINGDYKMLIQKQPGVEQVLYIINKGKINEEFYLREDKEIKL